MREDLAARLDRMTQTFEETRHRILAANEAVAALRVTRRSDDGLIEVTVGADRGIADLRIADEALDHGSGRVLARAILALTAQARAEMERTRQAEYQRLTGLTADPGAFDPAALGRDGTDSHDPSQTLGRLSRELFGA